MIYQPGGQFESTAILRINEERIISSDTIVINSKPGIGVSYRTEESLAAQQ